MNKEGWNKFVELCLCAQDKKDLLNLFDLFLTPEEKDNLALRFLIIQELLSQASNQRDMAKNLNVSIAKITRGSNELKRMTPKFIAYLREKLRS
jgi:TrpR family trp operon transcriptional repressor